MGAEVSPGAFLNLGIKSHLQKNLKSIVAAWENVVYDSFIKVLYRFRVECSNTFNESSY